MFDNDDARLLTEILGDFTVDPYEGVHFEWICCCSCLICIFFLSSDPSKWVPDWYDGSQEDSPFSQPFPMPIEIDSFQSQSCQSYPHNFVSIPTIKQEVVSPMNMHMNMNRVGLCDSSRTAHVTPPPLSSLQGVISGGGGGGGVGADRGHRGYHQNNSHTSLHNTSLQHNIHNTHGQSHTSSQGSSSQYLPIPALLGAAWLELDGGGGGGSEDEDDEEEEDDEEVCVGLGTKTWSA